MVKDFPVAKDFLRSSGEKFTVPEKFTLVLWCVRCVGCEWPENAIAPRQQGLTARISGGKAKARGQ
jgi:hypothetical protein